jgi:ferredoxin
MIGESAAGMHRRGNARLVEREEFLELLNRAEEKGFVLQAQNTREPAYVCCCCGDCCEVLLNAKKLPRPAEAFHTNYFAQVETIACNGCGRCIGRCQMEAVSLADFEGEVKAKVDRSRCIGCGLCVPTCPSGCMRLVQSKKKVTPPRNATVMYGKMYLERRGLLGAAIIGLKYLFGGRI